MKMMRLMVLALFAAGLCPAASAPVITETLVRIQTDPASGHVQAFFEQTTPINGKPVKVGDWIEVSWDIAANKTVTSNGKTYSYGEVLAAVQAIAQQERAEQQP